MTMGHIAIMVYSNFVKANNSWYGSEVLCEFYTTFGLQLIVIFYSNLYHWTFETSCVSTTFEN